MLVDQNMDLLCFTSKGLYCREGGFYIDPREPVEKALITHAHADHARPGMKHYLAHHHSLPVMKHRLGRDISTQGLHYGEPLHINGVGVSFHPAGHIPGSAQIRLEHKGQVWVVTGDFKTASNSLTESFEPVPCHTLITESTFALPIFRWKPQRTIMEQIEEWWKRNAAQGFCSIIAAYALGKAQLLLHALQAHHGPIFVHGAVKASNEALEQAGFGFPPVQRVSDAQKKKEFRNALVVAPPSALGSSYVRRFQPYRSAIASGWMQLRGMRRRRAADRGFVLSDHADWLGLLETVKATGAKRIIATHGYTEQFSQYLREQGYQAEAASSEFENTDP